MRSHLRTATKVARPIALLVGSLLGSPWLAAQSPAPGPGSGPSPTFDVASIKPSNSGGRGTTIGLQRGRYTATHVTLRTLIIDAYSLESVQLTGGPGWMSADH